MYTHIDIFISSSLYFSFYLHEQLSYERKDEQSRTKNKNKHVVVATIRAREKVSTLRAQRSDA